MDSLLICQTTSVNSKNAHPRSICQVFVIFLTESCKCPPELLPDLHKNQPIWDFGTSAQPRDN